MKGFVIQMKKRVFSLILAILTVLLSFPITAFAANDSYADSLRKQGFPESYIPALTALHNSHPNWNFEALITNESFSYAVSQERKTHSQQLIEKYSVNDGKGYYCTCSSCYKNGTYVVQEAPNWVSASQSAVEYYMNPLNFLDEKYVFQFENLDYNSNQTQDGVEKILANTWMYKSNITYKDKNGKTVTYSPATKYSEAIMKAAKNSGLSAYYLASKIVQEVGGSKPTADGARGDYKGYEGIYNYYNIGAYTGGKDGLYWASLDGKGAAYFTNTESVKLRQGASTSTAILATLPRAMAVTKLGETAKQSDGYVWYKVSVNGTEGYIRSDLIGDNYNRPWTNPYTSIINGAQYIADSFGKTQNTGYLQKFNVNPKSSDRHSHEYMANVSAATTEAYKTYTAFKGTEALNGKTTFIIPVYKDINPSAPTLKATVNANGTFTLSWNKITGADKYEIYYKQADGSYKLLKTVTGTSYTTVFAQYGKQYSYKMKAVKGSTKSDYSNVVNATNNKKLQTPTLKVAVNSNGTFKMTWNKVTGATSYQIYWKQTDGSYKLLKTVTGTSYTSGFAQYGKQYSYKMKAVTSKNSSATSAYSSVVNATNNKKLQTPTLKVSVNSNGTFKMTWNKVTGATSYQIYYKQADGSYKLLKTVTGTSYTSGFAQYGKQYSYKMKAVTSKNSSATSNYSSVVNATNNKKLQTPTLKVSVNSNGTFKMTWNKVTGATSYQIYWKQANGSYKLLKTVTGTSYTTVVAQKGKTYNYKVRAVTKNNSSAASNYSNVVSAKRK